MAKISFLLLAAVIACALGVVTSQHQARKLFNDLEVERSAVARLETEWTQLRLEQGTWATHKRVEPVAARALGMRAPDASNTVVLTVPEAAR